MAPHVNEPGRAAAHGDFRGGGAQARHDSCARNRYGYKSQQKGGGGNRLFGTTSLDGHARSITVKNVLKEPHATAT